MANVFSANGPVSWNLSEFFLLIFTCQKTRRIFFKKFAKFHRYAVKRHDFSCGEPTTLPKFGNEFQIIL